MKRHGPFYVLVYTMAVACGFGLVLAGWSQFTEERIGANQQAKIKRQILMALGYAVDPRASSKDVLDEFEKFIREDRYGEGDDPVWTGFTEPGLKGAVKGYAFRIGGAGFWGPIEGIMALENDLETVRGLTFYRDEETPGLGHEINADWFRDAFKGKNIRGEDGAVGFKFSRRGLEDKARNEVDTITGATETVNSVEAFMGRSIERFLDVARAHGIGEGARP